MTRTLYYKVKLTPASTNRVIRGVKYDTTEYVKKHGAEPRGEKYYHFRTGDNRLYRAYGTYATARNIAFNEAVKDGLFVNRLYPQFILLP